jgi:hypothetical protein
MFLIGEAYERKQKQKLAEEQYRKDHPVIPGELHRLIRKNLASRNSTQKTPTAH